MGDLAYRLAALVSTYSAIIVIVLAVRAAMIAARERRRSGEYAHESRVELHRTVRKPFYHLLFRRHSHPAQPLM